LTDVTEKKLTPVDVTKLSNQGLKNIVDNHRRKGATDSPLYLEALAEQACRTGKGLSFDKSFEVIRRAAACPSSEILRQEAA
jgi:hypothetical protein